VFITIAIILLQTFTNWNLHPDFRTGGTMHAHFAAIFISIGFIVNLFNEKKFNAKSKLERFLLITIIPVIYFIDAKYVLGYLFLLLLTIYPAFILQKLRYKIIGYLMIISLIASWYNFTDRLVLFSELAITTDDYHLNGLVNYFKYSQKNKLLNEAIELPKTDIKTFMIGAGAGTFLSYAAYITSTDYAQYKKDSDKSRFGFINSTRLYFANHATNVREKYGTQMFNNEDKFSSIFNYRSTTINLIFELGIIGIIIFIFFYINLIRFRLNSFNKVGFLVIVIFLFLLNINERHLEAKNYSILHFSLLGLLINNKINTHSTL